MKTPRIVQPCDDENDTELFIMLQKYVLEHYPNPERKDCLDSETLRAFVYSTDTDSVSNERFLHIFKCAECTRELMRFREERDRQEMRVEQESVDGVAGVPLRPAKAALL